MVPPYLLLAEANLGLGLLQSAEEFLSMANWSILKTPDCSNAIRSQVRHMHCCNIYSPSKRSGNLISTFNWHVLDRKHSVAFGWVIANSKGCRW